jgi:hypothetical protein
MSDDYPGTRPPNTPAILKGMATVTANTGTVYTIDFDTLECDCKFGKAWKWQTKKWVPANYCDHKLKAVASLIDRGHTELQEFYETEVGNRFNAFVVISAFHKELRRGDAEKALYWGRCVIPHRGRAGIVQYMRSIMFEETRDVGLAKLILRLSDRRNTVSQSDVDKAIIRFCAAPKKWELPWRYEIFLDEMRAYRELVKQFGSQVASGKDAIPVKHREDMRNNLLNGFATGDRVMMQTGLKGFYKSQNPKSHDHTKIELFNMLVDVLNGDHPNAFKYNADHAAVIQSIVLRCINGYGPPRYHQLNALADALSDPYEGDPSASLSPIGHKRIVNSPREYAFPAGAVRTIPLYAHDNHTWHGKALMRTYGLAQLQPGAVQDKMDFRLCGAYMGVAWRTLAFRQHATINVPWGDVSWRSPNWLYGHLDKMWY